MNESGHLDRLAQGLGLDERRALLEKLESQSVISKEPLYQEQAGEESADMETRYAKLPWYSRIWYFIVGLFRAQSPVKAFQNSELVWMGKALEQRVPRLYQAARNILLPDFYNAVAKLRDSSRFFFKALDTGFNRNKGDFFVFLGSLEMPDIHARLVDETSPDRIGERNPGMAESAIRQTALHALEETLGMITEEQRLTMYANARSLVCLKQLASFLYDRLLLAFAPDDAAGGKICSAPVIRDALGSLNNVLSSLKEIPSMALLSSLFVFILQDEAAAVDFNIETETKRLLTQAETAIAMIRSFNRQVPLTQIARVAARDNSLVPQPMTGGEDWFTVYREHWRKNVDDSLFLFFSQRRRRELQNMYHDFFGDTPRAVLGGSPEGGHAGGLVCPRAESLEFLLTFASAVFLKELNPALRPIMVEGEFSRPEHRLEFDEAYNELIRLDEKIKHLDQSLSPGGSLGKRYDQINGELSSQPVKRRKIQLIMEECGETAAAIVEQAKWAINVMVNLTGGFTADSKTAPAAGARHGGLANIEKLTEKTPALRSGLALAAQKFRRAAAILAEVELLESGKE
ncbi:MAG: DUF5312 domain-containing protein [Spirochaetaceae bacterium]|jgi:hypothetical protein|nr:DUF5312 domain-containing protein [Spirochaetaceae bacterium]